MPYSYNMTFHRLTRSDVSDADPTCLPAEMFEAVLDQIKGRDDVRVTFDDGNASDCEIALPALRNRGMRADFFICAGRIGAADSLDEQQIRSLLKEGMRVGSHGMDHRPLRHLSDADLRRELVEARKILEDICGGAIKDLACPFGSYDRRVLGRIRDEGYRTVFTSDRGPAAPEAWFQPRTTITTNESLADVERLLRAKRSEPRELARRLKIAVKRLR